MNKLKYIVRTVYGDAVRSDNVAKMKEQIPDLIVHCDYDRDPYKSFFDACELLEETGGVMLEDDVQLCCDFKARLEKIIDDKGTENIINFFEKPKTYFKTALYGGSSFNWTQCVYIPPHFAHNFKKYYIEFLTLRPKKAFGGAYDNLIGYAMVKEHKKYWRIRPCIVQHLDFKSLIGNRPTNRQTPYFIDDLEKNGVKYEDLEPSK